MYKQKHTSAKNVLYLNTRGLPLERDAQIRAALEVGLQVIIAAPDRKPFEAYPIEHIIEVPIGNYDAAQTIILQYLEKHRLSVHGVVCWTDKEVELTARMSTALGLPSSSFTAVENVRNKARLRQILEQMPALNPTYRFFTDEQSFKAALDVVGVPAIMKPAGASGGRGIMRIPAVESALPGYHAFKEYCQPKRDEIFSFFQDEALLEEELRGSEHSIAGIVLDKEIHTYAITDKKIDPQTHIQYQNVMPTRLPTAVVEEVVHITRKVIAATAINCCGFHMDFMYTPAGIKVLEVGGRYGGECINSHLIPLSIEGLSPYQILLHAVQGKKQPALLIDYTTLACRRAGMRILYAKQFGRIRRIQGLERIQSLPYTKAFLQLRRVGDRVYHPMEKYNAFAVAYVIVQTEHDENIEALLDEIASDVCIEVGPSS